jgi:uncharacterized SAM-binding protein YcdF (DUF218 family)
MAEIAQTMGVPASAILQDPDSHNTYQNAVNVRKILDAKGIKGPVLLVTSAMHMTRSLLIFKRQGIASHSSTNRLPDNAAGYRSIPKQLASSRTRFFAGYLSATPVNQSLKRIHRFVRLPIAGMALREF